MPRTSLKIGTVKSQSPLAIRFTSLSLPPNRFFNSLGFAITLDGSHDTTSALITLCASIIYKCRYRPLALRCYAFRLELRGG